MASFQGTNSGFESISPYRDYVNLIQPDVEFMTGVVSPISNNDNTHDYSHLRPDLKMLSTMDVIKTHPHLQEFFKWISFFDVGSILNRSDEFTLFAPIDITLFDLYIKYMRPEDLLQYHMTNYIITPVQLFDSKYRIDTVLRNHFILTDGMSVAGFDSTSQYDGEFIKIVETIRTKNGFIYLIDSPLLPYNLNR